MIERALVSAALIKTHESLGILRRYGPTVSSPRDFVDDLFGTGGFFARVRRMANEDLLAAGRISSALRLVRADDVELAYVRIETESGKASRLQSVPEEVLIQIVAGCKLGCEESYSNGMRTGGYMHMNIGRAVVDGSTASNFFIPVVKFDSDSVHK